MRDVNGSASLAQRLRELMRNDLKITEEMQESECIEKPGPDGGHVSREEFDVRESPRMEVMRQKVLDAEEDLDQ